MPSPVATAIELSDASATSWRRLAPRPTSAQPMAQRPTAQRPRNLCRRRALSNTDIVAQFGAHRSMAPITGWAGVSLTAPVLRALCLKRRARARERTRTQRTCAGWHASQRAPTPPSADQRISEVTRLVARPASRRRVTARRRGGSAPQERQHRQHPGAGGPPAPGRCRTRRGCLRTVRTVRLARSMPNRSRPNLIESRHRRREVPCLEPPAYESSPGKWCKRLELTSSVKRLLLRLPGAR
jgi:hypothetical protein